MYAQEMKYSDAIEIPLDNKKLILALLICIAFVMLGFFILNVRDEDDIKAIVVVIACFTFFGVGGIVIAYRVFTKQNGLVIDDIGIILPISSILVLWEDIIEFQGVEIRGQKYIAIIINNPDEYINKYTHSISRLSAMANYELFGSPLCISSNVLKCKYNELESILLERYDQVRQQTKNG